MATFEPMVKPDSPFRRFRKARTHLVWHFTWTQTDQRRQRLLDKLRECQRQWATVGVVINGNPLIDLDPFYWPRRATGQRVEVGRIFGFEGGSL